MAHVPTGLKTNLCLPNVEQQLFEEMQDNFIKKMDLVFIHPQVYGKQQLQPQAHRTE